MQHDLQLNVLCNNFALKVDKRIYVNLTIYFNVNNMFRCEL